MEKVARTFTSFADADAAEDMLLTPGQRIKSSSNSRRECTRVRLSRDLREFIELLNSTGVD